MSIRRKTKAFAERLGGSNDMMPASSLDTAWGCVELDYVHCCPSGRQELAGQLGLFAELELRASVDPFRGVLRGLSVSTLRVKLWPRIEIGQMCFFQLVHH